MTEDIEHLKVNKIVRPDGRPSLPVYGQVEPSAEDSEAYSGTTEDVPQVATDELRERIVAALKTVHDPEIPLNIYDLGLIYGFTIDDESNVDIEMTLTAPGCPVAGMLVKEVADKVGDVEGVRVSHVKLVWDPPWTKSRMSDEALLELGLL
ncbi:MAG: DUF59 domain-containing protein [Sandaracinaceae bacterium]